MMRAMPLRCRLMHEAVPPMITFSAMTLAVLMPLEGYEPGLDKARSRLRHFDAPLAPEARHAAMRDDIISQHTCFDIIFIGIILCFLYAMLYNRIQ